MESEARKKLLELSKRIKAFRVGIDGDANQFYTLEAEFQDIEAEMNNLERFD